MSERLTKSGKRLLDPTDRISEVLFGLIMVLTITCSFSIAEAGHAGVRQMLIGALGCNLAWGMIDAAMYLMARFSERGQDIVALRAVRGAADPERAHRIIADAMPPLLATVVSPAQFEEMRQKLNQFAGIGVTPASQQRRLAWQLRCVSTGSDRHPSGRIAIRLD